MITLQELLQSDPRTINDICCEIKSWDMKVAYFMGDIVATKFLSKKINKIPSGIVEILLMRYRKLSLKQKKLLSLFISNINQVTIKETLSLESQPLEIAPSIQI